MLLELWHRLRMPLSFYRYQRRWPSRTRMSINDVLYRIKMGDEILNPLRQFISDKEFVKIFIRAEVGEKYNVPTLAVLHSMEEVRAYDFPADCVIKCTDGSSRFILRRNGDPIDYEKIERWFAKSYYARTFERNYKYLQRKVIVEPYIFGGKDAERAHDFKFFCARGTCRTMFRLTMVDGKKRISYYDRDGNVLPIRVNFLTDETPPPLPENYPEMLRVAEKLSEHFSFIRVDMYSNGEEVLVGELTNLHANAREFYVPRESELEHAHYFFPEGCEKI